MRYRIALVVIGLIVLACALLPALLARSGQTPPVRPPSRSFSPRPSSESDAPSRRATLFSPAGWTEAPAARNSKHDRKGRLSGDCRVDGTVLSASGVPAPGAKVRLVGPSLSMSPYGESELMEVYASAESAADGRFELSNVALMPLMTVRADAEGAAASVVLDPEGDEHHKTVTLKLAPAGIIKGVVLDPEGAPVAGAKVTPFAVTPDPAQSRPTIVLDSLPENTAADGTFTCTGLTMGYWMFSIAAPGFLKERTEPKYTVGSDAELRLKSHGAVVTGSVVDAATGRPAPDVVVTASPDEDGAAFGGPMSEDAETGPRAYLMNPSKAKTGPDGTFRLSGLTAGQYSVGTPEAVDLWGSEEEDGPEPRWSLVGAPAKVSVKEGGETSAGTLKVAPSGAISGRVVWTGTDEPVSGAVVHTTLDSQDSFYSSKPTGPDGLYRIGGLPPGDLSIRAQSGEEYSLGDPRTVQLKAGTSLDGIDLTLKKALSATGTVLDPNRQPVAGARVSAAGRYGLSESGESGADGTFRIDKLVGSLYESIAASKDEMISEPVKITPESHENIVLVLRKGATVSGTLVDENNRPVANAVVVAMKGRGLLQEEPRQGKKTDSTGTFTLAGLAPGTYEMYAEVTRPDAHTEESASQKETIDMMRKQAEKELGASFPPEVVKQMERELGGGDEGSAAGDIDFPVYPTGDPLETVELAWGQNVTGMKLVLKGAALEPRNASEAENSLMKGRVVDESGKPVAGAKVAWHMGEEIGDSFESTSDAEGRFTTAGFGGSCVLKAVHPEYGTGYATARAGQQDVQIVLKRAGSIRGKVVDATGKPVPGCRVAFKEGARMGDGLWDTELPQQDIPDANSLLESLPEEVKANVDAEELSSMLQSQQISSERPGNFAEIHDPNCEFVLNNVPAGKATVFAMAKGYAVGCTEVDVPSGRAAENVVVKLEKGAGVQGFVVDSSGQPVAQAAIVLENDLGLLGSALPVTEGDGALAVSDEQGRFTLDTLLPGTTRLWAQHPNYAPGTATVVKGQTELRIVLDAGGAIEGVVTAEGKPATGATISAILMQEGHDWGAAPSAYEPAGPGGRFRMDHLPAGTFEVDASVSNENPEQYWTKSVEVVVENGKTSTVEIALEPEDFTGPPEVDAEKASAGMDSEK